MNSASSLSSVSCAHFFTPCSPRLNTGQKFQALSTCHKIMAIALAIIIGCLSVGYGGIVFFRWLCHIMTSRTEKLQQEKIPEEPPSLEKQMLALPNGELRELIASHLTQALVKHKLTISSPVAWQLIAYNLFKTAHIDPFCTTQVLRWEECDGYATDSISVMFPNGKTIYSVDLINGDDLQIACLDLKKAIDQLPDLTSSIKRQSYNKKNRGCIQNLKIIGNALQKRYQKQMKIQDSKVILCSKSMRGYIFDKLKQIILKTLHSLPHEEWTDQFSEPDFMQKVCKQLACELLFTAKTKVQNKTQLYFAECQISLNFEQSSHDMPKNESDIKKISLFPVNALTSHHLDDLPYISDQPLRLVQYAQQENKTDPATFDEKNKKSFDLFVEYLLIKYFKPLGGRCVPLLTPPSIRSHMQSNLQMIENDLFGNLFMDVLEQQFKVEHSWSVSGSCFISCFLPEYANKTMEKKYEKVGEVRARIATTIATHWEDYLKLVSVIPNFSKLQIQDRHLLEREHWVIAEDDSLNAKKTAILKRCQDLLESRTYLYDIEYAIVAELFQTSVWIYIRDANFFYINEKGCIVPHLMFGEKYAGKKITHLLADATHYKPLYPKQR